MPCDTCGGNLNGLKSKEAGRCGTCRRNEAFAKELDAEANDKQVLSKCCLAATRFLDCEEHGKDCKEIVCTECGASCNEEKAK